MSKADKNSKLLDKGMQGDEFAATGLEYVTDLMIRFNMIEKHLSRFNANRQHNNSAELVTSVRKSTVKLYVNIYKYQISIIRHYGHGAVTRFFKDVAGITNWEELRQEMETIDKGIATKQEALCNYIVLEIEQELAKFDAENMRQHAITQQAIEVRQNFVQAHMHNSVTLSALLMILGSTGNSREKPHQRT